MQEQRQRLSYGRLVSRASFYRDKALDLEQRVVFAEEQVESLKAQVNELSEAYEEAQEKQKHYEELKKEHEAVKDQNEEDEAPSQDVEDLRKQLEEKNEKIKTLDQAISDMKKGGEDESGRIAQFENLLAEVQTDLNDKEQQLEAYKARIKNLENRLATKNTTSAMQRLPTQSGTRSSAKKRVIAFFDYSMILGQDDDTIIRGHFHVENVGGEDLGTPYVCFRFYPIDASTLKGKIISIDQAERQDASAMQWTYLDDDWSEEAKERGEIWIRPYPNTTISPGKRIAVEDFQIPVKKPFDGKVIVEGFVYFREDDYKEKAANQILITF